MDSPYAEMPDKRATKQTSKHSRRIIFIGAATIALIVVLAVLINSMGGINNIIPEKSEGSTALNDRPSLETIYTASPLYAPDISYNTELGKDYKKNVEKKAKAMLAIADDTMGAYKKMKDELYENINILMPIVKKIDTTNKTNELENSKAVKELEELITAFELQELKYYSFDIDSTGEAYYDSNIIFERIASSELAVENIAHACELMVNISANIMVSYEGESYLAEDISKLQESFENSKTQDYAAVALAGVATMYQMMEELKVYNALVALDNLNSMGKNIDDVLDNADELMDSDKVDKEFAELVVMMADEYASMQEGLKKELEDYLDEVDLEISMEDKTIFGNPFDTVISLASYDWNRGYDPQKLQEQGMKYMKAEREALEKKYKDETYWQSAVRTASQLKKGVGVLVENIDTGVYEGMRLGAAALVPSESKDKYKEAWEDIKARHVVNKKRKISAKGGEEVFENAVKGFELVQKTAGDGWYNIGAAIEDELGIPEDTVSQVASTMGNLAAESFTQFGQGLSRVLNPNAKDSDIVKGCLEIGFSMAGGTNNIFSATKTGGAVIKKVGSVLASPKVSTKAVLETIKAIKTAGLPKLGSLPYKEAAINGTMAVLKKTKDVAENMAGKISDTFAKDLFAKTWKENLMGLKTYAGEVLNNSDEAAVKLVDEFLNGYIDNKVTDLASSPWLWDPQVSDEEKKAKLAEEMDKINQEVEEGLEEIEQQLQVSKEDELFFFVGKWKGKFEEEEITVILDIVDDEYAMMTVGGLSTKTEYYYSTSSKVLELSPKDRLVEEGYDFLGARIKRDQSATADTIIIDEYRFTRVNAN